MMMLFNILIVFLFSNIRISYCWDEVFKFSPCYEKNMDQKMPLSIDNLIAIVENYERENSNTSPENIANAILCRYRTNGVTYNPNSKVDEWSVTSNAEYFKQELDDKLITPSINVPENSFVPREECSLHMMVSHSTDFYPHSGVDYVWEHNYYNRMKRSSMGSRRSEPSSFGGKSRSQRPTTSEKNSKDSSSRTSSGSRSSSQSNQGFSYEDYQNLPSQVQPADHPIEFGVIQTSAGPIAGGLLLAGILASSTTREYTVGELIGSDNNDNLPSEMLSKRILPIFGATISGELAQAALLTKKKFAVGPIGMFGNSTVCPRLFTRLNQETSYLSRAEIFGGLDGFIIGKYLQQSSSSQSTLLSEILRMYYGNHGLYKQDLRACNRKNLFNIIEQSSLGTQMYDQALNYMYAYQHDFPDVASTVEQHPDDFAKIEDAFQSYLDPIWSSFSSFMDSYSYDDPGYYQCQKVGSNDVQYETQADLVVVFTPVGGTSEVQNQLQYIGLTARNIGVGYHRSRLAVLKGRNDREAWLSPMVNYTNVADYVCNSTTYTDLSGGGSSQDFIRILDKLTELYSKYYAILRKDPDNTGRNSQVVLWNLPNSFDGNQDEMRRAWNTFNYTYPDVTFIFAGQKNSIQPVLEPNKKDELNFVSTQSLNPDLIANDISIMIQKAPRMFLYAPCDTLVDEYSKYNEGSHVYTTYVSPNYTTLIRIPPQNFLYSETVELSIKSSNVRVCLSRKNSEPSEDDYQGNSESSNDNSQGGTYCNDAPFTYKQNYMCDRYLAQCDPIYISVSGKSDKSKSCTDEFCVYPNQIDFQMTHDGMICAASHARPTLLALLSLLLLYLART